MLQPSQDNIWGDENYLHLESSDTHHILVKSNCMLGEDYLEPLLQSHFPRSATIDLVVIDPPYGLSKANWDTSEDAQEWVTNNIPKIIDYCTVHEQFDPCVKFLIFHHFDNPNFWVCHFFPSFSPFQEIANDPPQKICPLSDIDLDQGYFEAILLPFCQQF